MTKSFLAKILQKWCIIVKKGIPRRVLSYFGKFWWKIFFQNLNLNLAPFSASKFKKEMNKRKTQLFLNECSCEAWGLRNMKDPFHLKSFFYFLRKDLHTISISGNSMLLLLLRNFTKCTALATKVLLLRLTFSLWCFCKQIIAFYSWTI